jgi:hypothetical protein
VLTELEALLAASADAGWTLDEGAHGVLLTANTRQTFSNTSDAVTAAQELLAAVQGLGFRLLGGSVGAEMPVESDGAGPWSGTLDVLLTEQPETPFERRLHSV